MDRVFNFDEQFQQSLSGTGDAKNIGWLCTYTPEEMIIASGFNPIRILGSKKLNKSESYFPINFCPYLKSGWEALLNAEDALSAVIFTNSCDGMRRLYDTAEHYLKDIPVYMLDVPRNTDIRAKDFFASKLEDLKVFLESLSGSTMKTDRITHAIELMDRKRTLLANFSRSFFKGHTGLRISDYYKIMELSTSSQINDFISEFEKLWDMLSSIDLRLVSDDLCISSRYYTTLVNNGSPGQAGDITRPEKDRLLRALSERYLSKPHCMRMADMGAKISEIEKKVIEDDVRGVIFISLKFCDTMLYSFPLIKQALSKLKIPVLYLEIEYNNFSAGQVKTRTQAFLEML